MSVFISVSLFLLGMKPYYKLHVIRGLLNLVFIEHPMSIVVELRTILFRLGASNTILWSIDGLIII